MVDPLLIMIAAMILIIITLILGVMLSIYIQEKVIKIYLTNRKFKEIFKNGKK